MCGLLADSRVWLLASDRVEHFLEHSESPEEGAAPAGFLCFFFRLHVGHQAEEAHQVLTCDGETFQLPLRRLLQREAESAETPGSAQVRGRSSGGGGGGGGTLRGRHQSPEANQRPT